MRITQISLFILVLSLGIVGVESAYADIDVEKILASDPATLDKFGWSVDVDGTTAVIGAPGSVDINPIITSSVYIFEHDGTIWNKVFQSDGISVDDEFGYSVAIDGDTIVVGAPSQGPKGSVYIFEYDGTDWIGPVKTVRGMQENDKFGTSVAINGDTNT